MWKRVRRIIRANGGGTKTKGNAHSQIYFKQNGNKSENDLQNSMKNSMFHKRQKFLKKKKYYFNYRHKIHKILRNNVKMSYFNLSILRFTKFGGTILISSPFLWTDPRTRVADALLWRRTLMFKHGPRPSPREPLLLCFPCRRSETWSRTGAPCRRSELLSNPTNPSLSARMCHRTAVPARITVSSPPEEVWMPQLGTAGTSRTQL